MLHQQAIKKSCRKAVKRPPAKHGRPDYRNVNISSKLGQSQSNSLVANTKVDGLDVTLDNQVGVADGF